MSARRANELSAMILAIEDLSELVAPYLSGLTAPERFHIARRFEEIACHLHSMRHDETSPLGLGVLLPGAIGYARQEVLKLAERLPR